MSGAAYALHGTTLGFDRPVPLLRGVETSEPAAVCVRLVGPRSISAPRSWSIRWADDGSLSQTWEDGVPWLRFRGAFDARCEGDEVLVRVRTDLGTVLRGVIDLVVPMLRVDQGAIGLHAAAFANDRGATLVLGDNGAGKSTLSALALALGWQVLADDCVVVEGSGSPSVARGVPGIGISTAVATELGFTGQQRPGEDKLDVALAEHRIAALGLPVDRIVLLGERWDGAHLAVEDAGGAAALAELANQCHAGLMEPVAAMLLDQLASLIDAVPVVRARVPIGVERARVALEGSGW